LTAGKYHPAISLYNGASVTVNFGPDFLFSPPRGAKGYFDCVDELLHWGPVLEEYKAAKEGRLEEFRANRDSSSPKKFENPEHPTFSPRTPGLHAKTTTERVVITSEPRSAMPPTPSLGVVENLEQSPALRAGAFSSFYTNLLRKSGESPFSKHQAIIVEEMPATKEALNPKAPASKVNDVEMKSLDVPAKSAPAEGKEAKLETKPKVLAKMPVNVPVADHEVKVEKQKATSEKVTIKAIGSKQVEKTIKAIEDTEMSDQSSSVADRLAILHQNLFDELRHVSGKCAWCSTKKVLLG
jgi:hypothetical protein